MTQESQPPTTPDPAATQPPASEVAPAAESTPDQNADQDQSTDRTSTQMPAARRRQPFARDQRTIDQPRKVRRGMPVKVDDPRELIESAGPWGDLVRSWLDLLNRSFSEEVRITGWQYAQLGQVASLAVRPGAVDAQVQGFEPRARRVTLNLPGLPADAWDRLVSAMAGEAIITATLLAGELPDSLPAVARRADVPINFDSVERIHVSQRIPEMVGRSARSTREENAPDEHGACAAYLVAERLRNDPLLLVQLRGQTVQQLLDRLRSQREAASMRVDAPVHGEPFVPTSSATELPLAECVDSFWGHDEDIAAVHNRPRIRYTQQALLRRLGPSPLAGKFPFVGLLASIYDHVSQHAIHLRDGAEHIEEPATDESDE